MTVPSKPRLRAESSSQVVEMQALWMASAKSPKRIELNFSTERDAITFRNKLYNAVRNARKDPGNYPALYDATIDCSVELRGTHLTIGRRELTPTMLALAAQLEAQGVDLKQELKHPLKREEEELGNRLMQQYGQGAMAPAPREQEGFPGAVLDRPRAVEDFMRLHRPRPDDSSHG